MPTGNDTTRSRGGVWANSQKLTPSGVRTATQRPSQVNSASPHRGYLAIVTGGVLAAKSQTCTTSSHHQDVKTRRSRWPSGLKSARDEWEKANDWRASSRPVVASTTAKTCFPRLSAAAGGAKITANSLPSRESADPAATLGTTNRSCLVAASQMWSSC